MSAAAAILRASGFDGQALALVIGEAAGEVDEVAIAQLHKKTESDGRARAALAMDNNRRIQGKASSGFRKASQRDVERAGNMAGAKLHGCAHVQHQMFGRMLPLRSRQMLDGSEFPMP